MLRKLSPHSANKLNRYYGSYLVDIEFLKSESSPPPPARQAGVTREVLKRKKQEQ